MTIRAPHPGSWLACGAALASIAAGSPSQNRRHPQELLPQGAWARLVVEDAPALGAALSSWVFPLPEGLDGSLRLRVTAGRLALEAFLGVSLPDAVGLFAPGPLAVAMVGDESPEWLAVSRGASRRDVEPLLETLGGALVWRWEDELLLLGSSEAALRRATTQPASGDPQPGDPVLTERRDGVRMQINLGSVRDAARGMLEEMDAALAVMVGPWVDALAQAGSTYVTLRVRGDSMAWEGRVLRDEGVAASPGDRAWEYRRPRTLLVPEKTIAVAHLDRDVAAPLADIEGFFPVSARTDAQGFLALADTLMGHGASFQADVLDVLTGAPEVVLVDPLPPADPQPRFTLPGIALVAPIEDDPAVVARMRKQVQRSMQAIQLIANTERKQEGKDGALVVRRADLGVDGALKMAWTPWRGPGDPSFEWGIEPTVFVAHGALVVASTEGVAEAALEALRAPEGDPVRGDYLLLRGGAAGQWIEQNASLLALERVLDEGDTMEQAREFIGNLAAVLGALDEVVFDGVPWGRSDLGGAVVRGDWRLRLTRRRP